MLQHTEILIMNPFSSDHGSNEKRRRLGLAYVDVGRCTHDRFSSTIRALEIVNIVARCPQANGSWAWPKVRALALAIVLAGQMIGVTASASSKRQVRILSTLVALDER